MKSPTEIFNDKRIFFSTTGFVNKVLLSLLAFTVLIPVACTSNSIVGKWKAVERFDSFEEGWVTTNEEVFVEFLSDGTYSSTTPGKLSGGKWSVDQSVKPNQLVFQDELSGTLKGVYILDGNTLMLKGYKDGSPFPTTLEPGPDEPSFELVKFERQVNEVSTN